MTKSENKPDLYWATVGVAAKEATTTATIGHTGSLNAAPIANTSAEHPQKTMIPACMPQSRQTTSMSAVPKE